MRGALPRGGAARTQPLRSGGPPRPPPALQAGAQAGEGTHGGRPVWRENLTFKWLFLSVLFLVQLRHKYSLSFHTHLSKNLLSVSK